jgi:cell pole-organizing protein PopZ
MSNDNDDLIIDLTELMDEEESTKKEAPAAPAPEEKTFRPKTETFDLGKELSKDDKPAEAPKEEFDFDRIFRESLAGITTPQKPEPGQPAKKEEQEFPFEDRPEEAPVQDIFKQQEEETFGQRTEETFEIKTEETFEDRTETFAEPAKEEAVIEAARESLAKDIPQMVESIARPVITELVNEIVASVKKDLPGIIEKVIREEIEKLKKID